MRWILAVLAALGLIIGFWPRKEMSKSPVLAEKIPEEKEYWFSADPKDLVLINNMVQKRSSEEEATISACSSGINALYYDKENRPLGWLQLNAENSGRFYKSNLLDGAVFVRDGRFEISRTATEEAVFGHQAGPILIFNKETEKANLNYDIRDQRSIAIQTTDNKAVFAYFEDATLAELPEEIKRLGEENGFVVINAINLDGGSSASFWNKNTRIGETFLSGGWWCKK